MHPATQRALGARAKNTARWLEYYKKELLDEMKRQNVQLLNEAGPLDDDLTMTITRGLMRRLVNGMRFNIDEIRKFSK